MVNKKFSSSPIPSGVEYKEPTVKNIDGNRMYSNGTKVFHSISFILKVMATDKDSLDRWKKRVGEEVAKKTLHDAIARGNLFHEICESYLKNECTCQYENNLLVYSMFQNVMNQMYPWCDIHLVKRSKKKHF